MAEPPEPTATVPSATTVFPGSAGQAAMTAVGAGARRLHRLPKSSALARAWGPEAVWVGKKAARGVVPAAITREKAQVVRMPLPPIRPTPNPFAPPQR